MNRENDLRTLQQLTEDAAVDARKLMLLANSLKPDDLQQQLEKLCSGFEDGSKKRRRHRPQHLRRKKSPLSKNGRLPHRQSRQSLRQRTMILPMRWMATISAWWS